MAQVATVFAVPLADGATIFSAELPFMEKAQRQIGSKYVALRRFASYFQ
jgi:hypothetical protein